MQSKYGTAIPGRLQPQSAGGRDAVGGSVFDMVAAPAFCDMPSAGHDLSHAVGSGFGVAQPAFPFVPHPALCRHGSRGG